MLVKYRMLSTITNAQFKADIIGIIEGTITSTAQLSAGADTTNSSFTGSYPTGTYTKVNATTNTFSKVHGTDAAYTHYFRLTFDAGVGLDAKWTNFALAQGYTSGTDTLLNSSSLTCNVKPNTFIGSAAFPSGINIVLTPKNIWFSSLTSGATFGIFDLGANGVTATYADNMRMCIMNTTATSSNIVVPYVYSIDGPNSAYTSMTATVTTLGNPTLKTNTAGSALIIENPAFVQFSQQGNQVYGIANLLKIGTSLFAMDSIYNTAGVRRIVAPIDYAIVTE
jgi:hypothetical protein